MLIWTFPCQKVISLLLAATPTLLVSDPSEMVPVGQPLELGEGARGHEQVLLARDGIGIGQVAHRHPVRVRGHHAERPVDPGHEHAGQQRPPLVVRRRTHHLAHRFTQGRLGELGHRLARLAHRRELHDRIGLQLEGRPGRGDRDVVAVVGERHRSGLQAAHDVGREPGRNDTTSVIDPDDLVGHLDREVEVGPRHAQGVARAGQEQAEQHRRRATAPSDGTAGRCQHLDECIAFGSELHRRQSFREVPQPLIAREEVCVTCKGSKGCGLWMTWHRA